MNHILNRRPGPGRYNTNTLRIRRNRLFMFRCKITGLFQFFFQCFKLLIEKTLPFHDNLPGIELIPAVPLINTDIPQNDDLLSFAETKFQTTSRTCKHNTGNGPFPVLQGKINMPGSMIFTIRYLTPDINPA